VVSLVRNNLKKKRVLVTGAGGFIGSHLVKRLVENEAHVHIFDLPSSNYSRLNGIIHKFSIHEGDLANQKQINRCIKKSKPEIIYHLAAFVNNERDLNLIDRMIDVNLKGTINLINSLIKEKPDFKCFINTGTCEEYGDSKTPFRESQREIPVSPYSASKVASTYFCQMINKVTKLPIITLRPFLTYGPGQDLHRFIPSLIVHCITRKDFKMTAGNQTREFNYIDDIIDAYILAPYNKKASGQVINIGNGIEYKIIEVAKKIVTMLGNPIRLHIGVLPNRPGETAHFFSSNEKAKKLLGWFPKVGLNEGLERTITWYKKSKENVSIAGVLEKV